MSLQPSADTATEEARDSAASGSSYRSILKSTSLIGGASVINILIGMVRTKFVAILLGPSGVGLLGMFNQITGLVGTVTSLGVGTSGVRQIAEAVGSGDEERVARTATTLSRTTWLTGVLGLLTMVMFSLPLSLVTFGTSDYVLSISILGITLLTGSISAGQICIVNGVRKISDLALIRIVGAVNGTLISIPCYYFWGQKGIVPSLLLSSLTALITSWWFARQVKIIKVDLAWSDTWSDARHLLILGVSFMGAGLVMTLNEYLIRVIMLQRFSLADIGLYQAAFNLSGILAGFVLGTLSADYYPRLTAVANDNEGIYRMVNDQSQVAILLALPGLAAMLVFSPLVVEVFYSASFANAVPILRWGIFGVLGRVFSWPMSYVVLAKGKGRLFFFMETSACIVHLTGVFFLTKTYGLVGAAAAFVLLYIFYTSLMILLMYKMVGRAWSKQTFHLFLAATIIMVALYINVVMQTNTIFMWTTSITLLAFVTYLCTRQLSVMADINTRYILKRMRIKR